MLSLIVPAHNEEGNVRRLADMVNSSLSRHEYELILVDDGSTDRTLDEMTSIEDDNVKVVSLGRHRGKSVALHEGMSRSRGDVIATMDADLQDDPSDIPMMLRELSMGPDMICGWRRKRSDGAVKRAASSIGNFLGNMVLGTSFHDISCPLKVFRRECLEGMDCFDSMHRLIPAIASARGFSVKEVQVRHYARHSGSSKYGILDRIPGSIRALYKVKFGFGEATS